jgi:hypothetical protein
MKVLARGGRHARVYGCPLRGNPYSNHQKGLPAAPNGNWATSMQRTEPRVWCKQCGLVTEYGDSRAVRAEFGPSWPFEVGPEDAPGLLSLPIAPTLVCACRAGKSVEGRDVPCERFSPGC